MSLSGIEKLMARTLILPPLWLRKRPLPLDASDPAVFEQWCASSTNQTLEEYCEAEWTRAPQCPPPPPPRTPFGGTAEVTPGALMLLEPGMIMREDRRAYLEELPPPYPPDDTPELKGVRLPDTTLSIPMPPVCPPNRTVRK